jgi:ankyrin repeat protein
LRSTSLHPLRFAAVLLTALTWSNLAFCDDASDMGIAAQNGDLKKVAALLHDNPKLVSSKSGFGETPLHMAAGNGHTDIVTLLLANKADINAKSDDDGATPLHWAVEDGNKNMVLLLLSKGADINAKANDGVTPLQEAEIKGHKDVADILRQHGGHE